MLVNHQCHQLHPQLQQHLLNQFTTVPRQFQQLQEKHTDLILFAPMTLVESLTKTNLLVVDMKSEIQSIHNQLSTIPFEEMNNHKYLTR